MKFVVFLLFILLGLNHSNAQAPFFPQLDIETQKWNFLDVSGKQVLQLPFPGIADVHPFSDGMAAVQDSATSLWGFINTSGKWAIQPKYEQIQDFVDSYAITSYECKTNCNQNQEGLLNDYISNVIDKKGKVVFTDNSQDEIASKRFFLDQNLGTGLFRVTMGYGFNDMKNLVNLKGQFLCETYSIFGAGGNIIYEKELKAYRCANKFYKTTGQLLLDLSKYTFVQPFSEGYSWANAEEELGDDSFITWNILLDRKGNEILRLNNAEYSWPKPVEKGTFTFTGKNDETYKYYLDGNKIIAYQAPEVEYDAQITIGDKLPGGYRFVYTSDKSETLIGFMNAAGEIYYKFSM